MSYYHPGFAITPYRLKHEGTFMNKNIRIFNILLAGVLTLLFGVDAFAQALDKSLQSLNSDYEAKRSGDIALSMPIVHNIQQGVFNRWLEKKGKMGGQHKIPRLSNDRIILEEILGCL